MIPLTRERSQKKLFLSISCTGKLKIALKSKKPSACTSTGKLMRIRNPTTKHFDESLSVSWILTVKSRLNSRHSVVEIK